jgi:Mor family transcriptional regulator
MRKDINTNDVKSDRKNGMTFAELMKKYKCEADTIMRRLKR